jgi:hypothetical protein
MIYISSFSLFLIGICHGQTHLATEIYIQLGEMCLFQEFNQIPMSVFVPNKLIYDKITCFKDKY